MSALRDPGELRPRNWLFLAGLGLCSLTVAGLGVFGWIETDGPVALLACAGVFCFAAQIVAACCGANFGRHTWRNAPLTRSLLLAGYLVAATFAAYSADRGWMEATSAEYETAVAERLNTRYRIETEIAEREGYVREAEGQRAAVRAPGPMLTAQLQAPYDETIQRHERRLSALRADMEAAPALPAERPRNDLDWIVLAAFILWQVLEPWLYHAAEKGRAPPTPALTPSTLGGGGKSHLRLAASMGAAILAVGATDATRDATEPIDRVASQHNQEHDRVALALSLRGKCRVPEIARRCGVHRATVYRWYAAHDATGGVAA